MFPRQGDFRNFRERKVGFTVKKAWKRCESVKN